MERPRPDLDTQIATTAREDLTKVEGKYLNGERFGCRVPT